MNFKEKAIELGKLTSRNLREYEDKVFAIEQALLEVEREAVERTKKLCAEIANNAGREGKDWIKNEILRLSPDLRAEEGKK